MAAFQQFYSLVGQGFSELNTALVTMLPKKEGATSVADYRPIRLIHSIAKLIAKILPSGSPR